MTVKEFSEIVSVKVEEIINILENISIDDEDYKENTQLDEGLAKKLAKKYEVSLEGIRERFLSIYILIKQILEKRRSSKQFRSAGDMENKVVEVQKETKISPATLARVSKCIKYGDGGYKNAIEKTDPE